MPRLHPYHYVESDSSTPSTVLISTKEIVRYKHGMDAYFYGRQLLPSQQLHIATLANDLSGVAGALFRHHGACDADELISCETFTQAYMNALRPNYETVKQVAQQIPRGTLAFPRDDDRNIDKQARSDMFVSSWNYVSQFPGAQKWARTQSRIAARVAQYVELHGDVGLLDTRQGVPASLGLTFAELAFATSTGNTHSYATSLSARAEIALLALGKDKYWQPDVVALLERDSSPEQIKLIDSVFQSVASRLNNTEGRNNLAQKVRKEIYYTSIGSWWEQRSTGHYYHNIMY